uniref:ATPase AAA-type core domain-containing protein n=1 Tax=Lactuca sativa TaxID=4236 RepID=A0A9R1VMV6_LACSA|nr:hypothetical protein LSAT_V11C500268610 [Lactuca sativa]
MKFNRTSRFSSSVFVVVRASILSDNGLYHLHRESDVGKTATAEGLAQRIANKDVPEKIEGKKVITLDMGLLVAGTKYCGEFEEKLKKLMEEIKQSDEIILFIDEVHNLIGAGAVEGAIDAANILNMQDSIGP